jgi:hypothetical protein
MPRGEKWISFCGWQSLNHTPLFDIGLIMPFQNQAVPIYRSVVSWDEHLKETGIVLRQDGPVNCSTHKKHCFIRKTNSVVIDLIPFSVGKHFQSTAFFNSSLFMLSSGPTEVCKHEF